MTLGISRMVAYSGTQSYFDNNVDNLTFLNTYDGHKKNYDRYYGEENRIAEELGQDVILSQEELDDSPRDYIYVGGQKIEIQFSKEVSSDGKLKIAGVYLPGMGMQNRGYDDDQFLSDVAYAVDPDGTLGALDILTKKETETSDHYEAVKKAKENVPELTPEQKDLYKQYKISKANRMYHQEWMDDNAQEYATRSAGSQEAENEWDATISKMKAQGYDTTELEQGHNVAQYCGLYNEAYKPVETDRYWCDDTLDILISGKIPGKDSGVSLPWAEVGDSPREMTEEDRGAAMKWMEDEVASRQGIADSIESSLKWADEHGVKIRRLNGSSVKSRDISSA